VNKELRSKSRPIGAHLGISELEVKTEPGEGDEQKGTKGKRTCWDRLTVELQRSINEESLAREDLDFLKGESVVDARHES